MQEIALKFYILIDQTGLANVVRDGRYLRSIFVSRMQYIRAVPLNYGDGTGCIVNRGYPLVEKRKL